jgi:hypothetical protein
MSGRIPVWPLLPALLTGVLSAQGAPATPVPYDDYPSLAACVAAGGRELQRTFWNQILDTMPNDPTSAIEPGVQSEVRRCIAVVAPKGLLVSAAPDRDVAAHFYLGRGLAADSIATGAWHRALRMQKIRDDSTSILWHLSNSYTYGHPADLAVSARMARWLDTLGVIGERPFLPNDSFWISQHGNPDQLAHLLVDTAAMRTEVAGVRKNLAALPANGRKGSELTNIGAQGEVLLLELLVHPRSDSAIAQLKAKSIEQLGRNQEEIGYGGAMLLLGEHYGPVHPDFWFNETPADSIHPRAGRVTLVQVIDPRNCTCDGMAATLHRLKARYRDSLDIVLLAQTAGHFNGKIKLAPKDEADLIARRVREEWHVDYPLGVYITTFVPNPDPDRRLVGQVIPDLRHLTFSDDLLVIDRRGVLVLTGVVSASPWSEPLLNRLLEALFRAPAN